VYILEEVWQEKARAKRAVFEFLGPGLTERQLREKCTRIFR
jgi:hypothetical protein